ncbi:MAG: Asp-tRNA(Asn)/Glu-tRNA(Gln) amidotransferase subunit GatB [bacterium]|nr:Asp-tRNA(Asn)/Glu-tRNA(Gln) amidotransferase subunit GatB [bacterium]
MDYIPTIGLEIHAELKTRTKMFCHSLNDPLETKPNVNICPVCTGQPGTLPTINKRAIELMVKIGLALDGKIAERTKFDRKNYFYPDLPKGYQISQYDQPIVSGGNLLGVRITRVHLEEDAGRLLHSEGGPESSSGRPASLVDYNRAGLPLMELVTEPDITNAKQASEFAKELQRILRYLDASDADMEKGQMRVEANISIRPNGTEKLGTKVEVKNLNSFRAVEDAIAYEIDRQQAVLLGGGKIIQETRGWDENKKETFSQRIKEEAHDYRYFPEPDLPQLVMSESGIDVVALKKEIPELPMAKRDRFMAEYALLHDQADALVAERANADYFEQAVSELETEEGGKRSEAVKLLYNYFSSDFWGLLKELGIPLAASKITPENFADLIMLLATNKISSRSAKDLLRKMNETGSDPRELVKTGGLEQISDTASLEPIAQKVMEENPKVVADYKKGKTAAIQSLIGKTIGATSGKANPSVVKEIFERLLK